MKNSQLWLIVLTVSLLSIGQVLFKFASGKINLDQNGIIKGVLLNPALIFALIIYASATVAWVIVLSRVELRVAYPYAALAFLIVPTLSHLFLGELFSINTIIGGFIILIGVYVSSL